MRLLPVGALTLACLTGCSSPPPPLSPAYPSAQALAREVLVALYGGDESRLKALALSEHEFRVHVWPELPASRPERNLPFSYVWGDLRQKSEGSLKTLIARYRGREFVLTGVRFAGATTPYATHQVHRETIFDVRAPDGPAQLRACGSMIEKDGRWKVFSYVIDD